MKRINKNKKLKIGALILVLVITIGYAILRTGLNINGIAHVSSSSFNVHFENYQKLNTTNITPTTEPTITGTTTTTINYEVTLTKPGDVYEFTVDAVNSGTIDAMIESISSKLNDTEITSSNLPAYLEYSATYSDGKPLAVKQQLLHNTREAIKLKVKYRDDIEISDLPSTIQNLTFTFTITYAQADDTAEEVVHGLTGTRYTVNIWDRNDSTIENGTNTSVVWIGKKPTDNITLYNTVAEAKNAFNNRPYYLKHEIENDIVKDSYVCFEKDGNTYCLRGQATYEKVNNNWQCKSEYYDSENNRCISTYYESNKAILKNAYGESNCIDSSSYLRCSVSGLNADAYEDGGVGAFVGSAGCDVSRYGPSGCGE